MTMKSSINNTETHFGTVRCRSASDSDQGEVSVIGLEESRTALDEKLADEMRRRVLNEPGCVKFTMIRHQGLGPQRESLKPVKIRGEVVWQAEKFNGKQVMVRNHPLGEPAATALEHLLSATGAREYHLTASSGDLHVRITRKGRNLVSRGKPVESQAETVVRDHDHGKDQPLGRFDSVPLLKVLGMADGSGQIRATMRGKADQINAFLRELDNLLDEEGFDKEKPLNIVDCGCGRAYLTLSAYCYLTRCRGLAVQVRGIDRNASIMDRAREMASALDVTDDVQFLTADLADCTLDVKPDLLLSLHACDTATDLAIAHGVEWGVRYMLVAPCCQHDLQGQIKDTGPMRALLRHGILRERQADLLTDAFRAQILRILGFRVRILEFVSSEATARNIMLRAVFGVKKGIPATVDEYVEMRDFWKVKPVLEKLLENQLERFDV